MTEADLSRHGPYPTRGRTSNLRLSTPSRSLPAAVRPVVIALTVLAALLASTLVAVTPASAAMNTGEQLLADEMFGQLNRERAARGLPALQLDTSMNTATHQWSERLERDGYLSHSTDGRAEIVAYGGTTGQITNAWMQSPGHRHLITDRNLVPASVAVNCDRNGTMWAVVQFRRIDTTKPTQSSSSASPVATPSNTGGSCSNPPTPVSGETLNSIRRLYQAYYLRAPDAGGLQYWRTEAAAGMTIWRISDHFASSNEFVERYGSLSNRQFISLVYRNVMGREPDAGGQRYWLDRLAAGTTRGELMTFFSDSPEYRQRSGIS